MSGSPAKVSYVTTALYRRYRPETFQDVIGQEHVTEPLMTALRKNRVSHAYLFSGPRGCGKTTSARILARCLNCAEGPTATPCGHCDSCEDIARDGAGSLDVIEMDAASHGGVDHARDLRERATFAPVRDRYKIFIIDEAHMVTREGFNALLKIVEEPPEHVKFIFATTEPAKVLTTIRSRTHHYPFRLVPPEPLMHYLEQLCEREGVGVEPGVLSLVVRAGGGSVRDSLSVLDQLMAGSEDAGITYDLSVALLGFTHAALLDDVLDAFAAGDAATVFGAVDRVIQTGQDPRRFVEDLLERFRDLVVVNAVPDSAANILHGMPTDQVNRLRNQASQLGAAELSRAADITNTALNEMTGATSPQLHLELLCARILLPSADDTSRGVTARVDRLERRLSIPRGAGIRPGTSEAAEPAPAGDPAPALPPSSPLRTPEPDAERPQDRAAAGGAEPTDPQDDTEEPEGTAHPGASGPVQHPGTRAGEDRPPGDGRTGSGEPEPAHRHEPPPRAAQQERPREDRTGTRTEGELSTGPARGGAEPGPLEHQAAEQRHHPDPGQRDTASQEPGRRDTERRERDTATAGEAATGEPEDRQSTPGAAAEQPHSGDIELLRSSWTEIVSALAEIRRVAWTVIMRGTPVAFDGGSLRIAFEAEGDLLNFPRFENDVRAAIHQVLGIDCRVEAVRPGDVQGRSAHGGEGAPGPRSGDGPGRTRRPPHRGGQGDDAPRTAAADGDRGHGPSSPEPARSRATGRGPGRSPGSEPGPDASPRDTPEDEPPEYFREPEGFGANRRHRPGPGGRPPQHPQRRAAQDSRDGQGTGRREDRHGEPAPGADEPVTSWSVVQIPQDIAEAQSGASTGEAPSASDRGTHDDRAGDEQDARSREREHDAHMPASGQQRTAPGADQDGDPAGHTPGRERSPDGTRGENGGSAPAPTDSGFRAPQDRGAPDGSASGPVRDAPQDLDALPGGSPGGAARSEYWSPPEPPPLPEDEPPADLYEPSGTPPGSAAGAVPEAAGHRTSARAGTVTAPPAAQATAQRARPSWRERHAAEIAAARQHQPGEPQATSGADEDFVASADDESIEDSALHGRAAIERLLGGILIDERPHNPDQ